MNVFVGSVLIITASIIAYKLFKPVSHGISKRGPVASKHIETAASVKKVNPYFAFCKKKRPDIVAANPELNFREITKKLSEEYRKLSDVEKDEYRIAFTFSKPK